MTVRRNRKPPRLVAKATELALAVPQVVALRLARMALAGPLPSRADQLEFQRMGDEKARAFSEAWQAMALQALVSQQALVGSLLRSMGAPTLAGRPTVASVAAGLHDATLAVLDKGLAPVHRRAVANARRLARRRPR